MPVTNPDLPDDGENADAADYNVAIQAILAVLNGNIDADNLAAAGVTTTKIADNAITIAKISLAARMATMGAGPIQGYMVNGKIVPSVSSNNLTLAIKTLADGDPSASDPVYIRIGNTVRAVTAALSVTTNAGTSWFGSGGAMFATQEVDYFVYLGYNATDGVTIGFARIPFATTYGDFSATSTNEKYAAISNISNASSTDQYEVVGRFNAILAGTGGFEWSLPGTAVILSRPVFSTRQLTYVPTTATLALGTGGTITASYTITNRFLDMTLYTILGTGGTHATASTYTTPFTVGSNEATALTHGAVGIGTFLDNSASKNYQIFIRYETANTIRYVYTTTSGEMTTTVVATPAVNDTFFSRERFVIA